MRIHISSQGYLFTIGVSLLIFSSLKIQPSTCQLLDRIYNSIVDRVSQLREVFPSVSQPGGTSPSVLHPDAFRNFTELAESRGFRAEVHKVTTFDGYIITVFHLVNPLVTNEERALSRPVIVQHGIMCSSDDFITNSLDSVRPARPPAYYDEHIAPELNVEKHNSTKKITAFSDNGVRNATRTPITNALAFALVNNGYDVWLPNTRGNTYSKEHTSFTVSERVFWDFSLDEMVRYDLPAVIDYVQKKHADIVVHGQQQHNKLYNKTKVAYIGHSQGTTMMFALLASQPDIYTDIIEPFIALAPVVYLQHVHTPIKYLIRFKPLTELFTSPVAGTGPFQRLLPLVCLRSSSSELCTNTVFLATGFNERQYDKDRISVYVHHVPTGTSWKVLNHYGQMYEKGVFQMYDHGPAGNQAKYAKIIPPAYNVSDIRSRSIVLMSCANDWFGPPQDVARLRNELKVPLYSDFYIDDLSWSHLDFMFAKDAGIVINTRIITILNEFSLRSQNNSEMNHPAK